MFLSWSVRFSLPFRIAPNIASEFFFSSPLRPFAAGASATRSLSFEERC
jgi:hypothetical protein